MLENAHHMKEKAQFNVRISKLSARRARIDAKQTGRSLDDVSELIFDSFYQSNPNPSKRRHLIRSTPPKVTGRKIG